MESIGALSEELMEGEEGAGRRGAVFGALKTYCTDLLELLRNPKQHCPAIPALLDFLRSSSSDDLQPFFDYILFPLLLLLDAAIGCRSSYKMDSDDRHIESKSPAAPYRVSDSVAEGVLNSLEELLKKCSLNMLNQMVVLLKKLTHGALLSASEATEEFREGIIKCFKAMLINLCQCTDDTCLCKQITGLPALLKGEEMQTNLIRHSKCKVGTGECLLAFLQSQDASAAVGHWLSLLLKAADVEAVRGHRGSASLRIQAFLTLRVLVAKVGTADALAFFLPGVVSQFTKVMYVSKTMMSGAAGNLEATDHAIRGLAEYLMIVLQDGANASVIDLPSNSTADINSKRHGSTYAFLEKLQQLPANNQSCEEIIAQESGEEAKMKVAAEDEYQNRVTDPEKRFGSFHVSRTKDWMARTSANVQKLLSATFPQICVHPSTKLRQGLLAAVQGLLTECRYSLNQCRLMLLECLCLLVVDDSEEVASSAQEFLECLFSSDRKEHVEHDIMEILNRLIEVLPKVVLGSEESLALAHAQQLLVILYYAGPQLVMDQLLHSPVAAARFLDALSICMSHNSVFAGSLNKLVLARTSSTGYFPAVAELKAQSHSSEDRQIPLDSAQLQVSEPTISQQRMEYIQKSYELPRMPPWFVYVGSQKLYQTLAQILRLVGLSLMADSRSGGHLSVVADIPLGYIRKLVSEVRIRDYNEEGWQLWYKRSESGQLLRQASIAVCILNEMVFGLSDQAVKNLKQMFHKPTRRGDKNFMRECSIMNEHSWKFPEEEESRGLLIACIGRILHEYLCPEVWNLPLECGSSTGDSDGEVEQIPLHLFTDTVMLQQVIIEGIGIFNMCLGKDFATSGFLHSTLYLLLEKLVSANFHVRSASDAVLHVISLTSGYTTVGELVLTNADYIIDSICRQLYHLDLNPHVPNVLAAMLSFIGVAEKILPLLEEPMRSVSHELEILGRHQHPDLTIPFLKAVAEIVKSSKRGAPSLIIESESLFKQVEILSDMLQKSLKESKRVSASHDSGGGSSLRETEQWEEVIFKLNNSKRYRRTVGSVAASCLTAATPLLVSSNQAACLLALNIIEDGISTLANVEAAYKHERETKEAIEEVIQSHSLYKLQDTMDAADEGTDENRLLPAMNRIWPFLVACIQNNNPVVIRRCVGVVSSCVQICGGDFFSRRFHIDGSHFWRLLSTSPYLRKADPKEERIPLRLPYRSSPSSEQTVAEVSSLKVQVAVLNMIADLSRNKKSSSALRVVLKKVSGLVVGIACSGVVGLRDASINALHGLAFVDPDLVWLLLADVYFSLKKDLPSPPSVEFPELDEVLPPPSSSKQYIYVQYGGQSYGFDVSSSSVEIVFKKLHTLVFNEQMYR